VVDPVTLVVTALASAAGKGLGEAATSAVKDAYRGLRGLVVARFAGQPSAELVLAEHEKDPDTWRAPLVQQLSACGLVDGELVEAAQALLALLGAAGARAGKYSVDVRRAYGVQVGDHNTQTNTFTTPPPGP
jgi:hypothetical protein